MSGREFLEDSAFGFDDNATSIPGALLSSSPIPKSTSSASCNTTDRKAGRTMVRHLVVPVSSPSANSVGLWSAEAAVEVPVLNAHRLHEGMGHHRADEPKTSAPQFSSELL